MSTELHFVTLDVFTSTRFHGNPLAIVYVPPETEISQEQKLTICKEFNLSETVFLHRPMSELTPDGEVGDVKIDIFTPAQELPFAGHPTVGTSFHLLSRSAGSPQCSLITKAGPIPASFDPSTLRVKLEVPHAITIHSEVSVPREKIAAALGVSSLPTESIIPNDTKGEGVALVSVVKGLAFLLVQVSSLEVLGAMKNTGVKQTAEKLGLQDQSETFIGTYVYYVQEEQPTKLAVRTRMFEGLWEDAATGSAASCLAGYLSIQKAWKSDGDLELQSFEFTQGVEMGRQSDIGLAVQIASKATGGPNDQPQVEKMWLSGTAVTVMKGTILV
ncbi:Diaminopimelate epimerase-like protein [Clavulina sp. PMI_390]|nr:Diaminopimelate epimerase-like protein [Clavulina sp. PMI_390]